MEEVSSVEMGETSEREKRQSVGQQERGITRRLNWGAVKNGCIGKALSREM